MSDDSQLETVEGTVVGKVQAVWEAEDGGHCWTLENDLLLMGVPYAVDQAIKTNAVRERRTTLAARLAEP